LKEVYFSFQYQTRWVAQLFSLVAQLFSLNRGNQRDAIFHKDGDYEAFERVLNEGLQKFPVD